MGYSKNAIKGISWMTALRGVTRVVSFVKVAILARLLTPSQFGVFAIATIVLSIWDIFTETGINIFLIQSKEVINEYVDSAWVISILRGIGMSAIIIASAPLVSHFFNAPQAKNVLLLTGIIPLLRGFINPSEISLQKELRFNYEFAFRSAIFIFDALVSIILVLITHGVYGIILGIASGVMLEIILSFIFIKPTPHFKLRKIHVSKILRKGRWVSAFGIFNYLAQEGDAIILGRIMGSSILGLYQMAEKISLLPISEVSDVVNKVVFPIYARIETDKKRLGRAFVKSTFFVTISTTLMGLVILIFSRQIVTLVLGNPWLPAVPVLRILAVYGIIRSIAGSVSPLFLGIGKQKYITLMTFVRFISLSVTIYPFITLWGIIGAGYSALFSAFMEIPVVIYFCARIFFKRYR